MAEDSRIRVKTIAVEFGVKNKDVSSILQHLKLRSVSNHNTILSEEEAEQVRQYIQKYGVKLVNLEDTKKTAKVFVRRKNTESSSVSGETSEEECASERGVVSSQHKSVSEEGQKKESHMPVMSSAPVVEESKKTVSHSARAVVIRKNEEQKVEVRDVVQKQESLSHDKEQHKQVVETVEQQKNVKHQVRVIGRTDPRQWKPPTVGDTSHSQNKEDYRKDRGRHNSVKPTNDATARKTSYTGKKSVNTHSQSYPVADVPDPRMATQSKKKQNKNKKLHNNYGDGERTTRALKNYNLVDDVAPRRTKLRKEKAKKEATPTTQPLRLEKRKIRVDEVIRIADMAHQMGVKATELIRSLFALGVMATVNQSIDIETAAILATEYGYEVESVGFSEEEALLSRVEDTAENLKPRPPVVTIMGHVDHGKTSLLDAIRRTNVTDKEAGGITQHIGAYHVTTPKGDIVFLDTPGHEAFTAMRIRGAEITDLVVLVVAADDGVMEQTREAISHAKAANVSIMVAVNKMDKEGANPERVQRELAELGLVPEEWGGDTIYNYVSAKQGTGIENLLEMIALQSDILELKANPDKPARGRIVEAHLDKGKGAVATVLVQEGTLRQGDFFLAGTTSGRVRAMFNDQNRKIKEAKPAFPVEIYGFSAVPEAGEEFIVLEDEKVAKRIAEARLVKQRERQISKTTKVTLESFLASAPDVEVKTLNLLLKADVQGSLEAITQALNKLSTDKVAINIVHSGTGTISESDILLASTAKAIVIGFNVRPIAKVRDIAEKENIDIRFYDVIYNLSEDIEKAMRGMLAPVQKEVYLGQAEVRQIFVIPKQGTIAGAFVTDGKVLRNAQVRLLRDGVVIYTGAITSLKRFKDDVREVAKGYECGFMLQNFNDLKEGDIVETFEIQEEKADL